MAKCDLVKPYLEDLQNGNISQAELARQLGVSRSIVKDTLREWRSNNKLPIMKKNKSHTGAFEVVGGTDTLDMDPEPEEMWEILAARSRKLREKGHKKAKVIEVKDDKPICISAISDQHIGGTCDYDQMKADAETIRDTEGMFAKLAGDGIDNHIKIFAAALAQDVRPSKQLELFELYLSWFGDSIMCLVAGNHDLWTKKLAGFDVMKALAKTKRILYHPEELKIIIKLGSQKYRFIIRHKARYNSIYNAAHGHAQLWRLGDWDWDVAILAHTHTQCCIPFTAHGRDRWALRPGAYQIHSAYAEEEGFAGAFDTRCPSVILYPDKHCIQGIQDVEMASRIVTAERAQYS